VYIGRLLTNKSFIFWIKNKELVSLFLAIFGFKCKKYRFYSCPALIGQIKNRKKLHW